MIIEEDIYLEHYGKKGMQWGVRTAKTVGRGTKTAAVKTGRGAKATAKWVKENPEAALAIVGGVIWVTGNIASYRGQTKVNANFSARASKPSGAVKDIINRERDVKISAIKRTFKEGHMNKEQMDTFLNTINKRYDRRVAEAV